MNFSPHMPKLNTSNSEVASYLLKVATFWIQETNIDGWRLDVANEIDHHFWRKFRQEVKEIKPDIYICGEIWHDSQAWLNGDQFDGVMNYPLAKPIQEWFATERIDGIEFLEEFIHAYTRYPKNQLHGMMTLLDSHDTVRITTQANRDIRKVTACYALLSTLPGSICFYYGSELYLEGGEDPDNRRCMPWNQVNLENDLKKLIRLRNTYPEYGSSGEYRFLFVEKESIIFVKERGEAQFYFIFNRSGAKNIHLPAEMQQQVFLDLLKDKRTQLYDQLWMQAYSYMIVKKMED